MRWDRERALALRRAALLAATAVLVLACGVSAPKNVRPNVLVVALDAARADHLGYYGYRKPTTPEIDEICRHSAVFVNAYAVAPYTIPSTTSLFTALYPDTHAVLEEVHRLPGGVLTMPEHFSKAGFRTVMVGNNPSLQPLFGGRFNVYVSGASYTSDRCQKLTARVLAQLETVSEPFFCYVHYLRPHQPYDAPEAIRATFGREGKPSVHDLVGIDQGKVILTEELKDAIMADYDAALRTVDGEVGKLFRFLKRKTLLDRTVVVILSDHGEAFGEHGKMGHNSTVYDEMIHVPLIFHWPGRFEAGRRTTLAQTVDVFPTLAELVAVPLAQSVQGQSLLSRTRSYAFARSRGEAPTFAVRSLVAKLIHNSDGRIQFFDLRQDPLEEHPFGRTQVAAENTPELDRMETSLSRWLGFCLINNRGASTVRRLDPELLERLKSLGYAR